jgi:membrane-bound lytic murein transglycosylase A
VASDFTVYQSSGKDERRTVTFSAYYEPTLAARFARSAEFRFPIYGRPNDLIDVELGQFDPSLQGMRIAGRREGRQLVPYATRGDIDSRGYLKGERREIAWARDPVDIFYLQVEGSGWLDVGGGERVRIRFDGHNGRRYGSVGQHLIQSGRVKKEGFNHEVFTDYMRRHPEERQALLNMNERYIFFQLDRSSAAAFAHGNINVPLTPGRSIATDPRLFPKGGLAWVDFESPDGGRVKRFVMNQDEGGAIKGPARVDFFVGGGSAQESFAFRLWHPGVLYFLVKKRP